jgi:hypothetical protein
LNVITEETSRPSGFRHLEDTVLDSAKYRVRFGRDESDSFSLNVRELGSQVSSSLEKSDLFPLLPTGSEWSETLGWRSFFGVPCRLQGTLYLGLGLVKIVSHSSRGAFPRAEIYFLEFDEPSLGDRFETLSGRLNPTTNPAENPSGSYGAILANAPSPEEHGRTEVGILRRAGNAYREGKRLLFRTAILSEDELPPFSYFSFFRSRDTDESILDYSQALYGIIPPVYERFGWQSKLKIFLERDVTL